MHSKVLGALRLAVSGALRELPTTTLEKAPRMADSVKGCQTPVDKHRSLPTSLPRGRHLTTLNGSRRFLSERDPPSVLTCPSDGNRELVNTFADRGLLRCSMIVRCSETGQPDRERLRCSVNGHSTPRLQRTVTPKANVLFLRRCMEL